MCGLHDPGHRFDVFEGFLAEAFLHVDVERHFADVHLLRCRVD
jgi:hypothetical protein